jgi:geranylgeranyl pyrophosphate synthase
MEAQRKPKGSVGADLQIRNLDAETLYALQELQQHFRVGTNSKAALSAVRNFIPCIREVKSLRAQLQEAKETIEEQIRLLNQIGNVVDTFRHSKNGYEIT